MFNSYQNEKECYNTSDVASIFLELLVEWPWSITNEVSDMIMQLEGSRGKSPENFGLFALPQPRNG